MPGIFVTPNVKTKIPSPAKQISIARQSRLKVQNILARRYFKANSTPEVPNSAISISNMLEEITRNISKMDQNLYSAKANMEEIIRMNISNDESVSLN